MKEVQIIILDAAKHVLVFVLTLVEIPVEMAAEIYVLAVEDKLLQLVLLVVIVIHVQETVVVHQTQKIVIVAQIVAMIALVIVEVIVVQNVKQ